METIEKQIAINTTDKEISAAISRTRSHNPGLRALLSIKKNTTTLEEDYAKLLQIESKLNDLNQNGLAIIEANTSPEATAQWKAVLQETEKAITGINDNLTSAKEKIAQKEKDGYPELWKLLAIHLTRLKDNSKNSADSGFTLLPEAIHQKWEMEYVKPKTPLLESFVTQVESYMVLLKMIERYTAAELNSLTQIIVDHIPSDFTYEEAVEYQKDYYKALVNFKKEFKKDKNLWDKFLDILAGGTHQLPSEGAMMERWLDGEEAEV